MVDFWEKRFDVLVCTTIVESGLDVSNANTMIIERADTLGLSQLHQLRGRVGRSRERAYAYFLYPPEKPLTETAHDRLTTIAQHSELGGGMAVAMKDLEIRGAGNLLGGEQSGHIADVGFDLYVRLVGEAVAEFRGDAAPEREVKIELPIEAHLPHDYVQSERLRLEMYKRLADVRALAEVDELRAELVDRYGEPPEAVEVLLEVARLRVRVRDAGLDRGHGGRARTSASRRSSCPTRRRCACRGSIPRSTYKVAAEIALVPRPKTAPIGGEPLRRPRAARVDPHGHRHPRAGRAAGNRLGGFLAEAGLGRVLGPDAVLVGEERTDDVHVGAYVVGGVERRAESHRLGRRVEERQRDRQAGLLRQAQEAGLPVLALRRGCPRPPGSAGTARRCPPRPPARGRPCSALSRSSGTPPNALSTQPSGPLNSCFLTSTRGCAPPCHITSSIVMKSQLDVCGAPTRMPGRRHLADHPVAHQA